MGWNGVEWVGWRGDVEWSGVGGRGNSRNSCNGGHPIVSGIPNALVPLACTKAAFPFRFMFQNLFHLGPRMESKVPLDSQGVPFDSRGFDKRSNFQRNRHRGQGDQKIRRGADTRKRKRKSCLSDNCPHQGRRGWAMGFCKSCAAKKGYRAC